MATWEYRHEHIAQPLRSDGGDVAPDVITALNRLWADGWEVCSVVASPPAWIVLLKREVPTMGAGGAGGSGGAA
jgi:hypothetical protein